MNLLKALSTKELNDNLNAIGEEPISNYKSGLFKAKSFIRQMKHSFIHGKRRGETTRFESIDPCFTWKKGFVQCWTGYPNHGKSEMLFQMAITKSLHDGWKWAVFCPENMSSDEEGNLTPEEIFDTLIHAYIGKTTDPKYVAIQMSIEDYERGIEFVDKHFTIVYPEGLKTPSEVLKHFEWILGEEKIDGCIVDPWNKLIHNYTGLLDEYLATQFAIIKDFSIKNNLVFNIVEHPKGGVMKQSDGGLPVPDAFNLRGGAMWNNAMDAIIAIHRPNYHMDKTNQSVDFVSHKIRNQKLVGFPGTISLQFDRKTNRYYEHNGNSPLHVLPMERKDVFKGHSIEKFEEVLTDEKAPF